MLSYLPLSGQAHIRLRGPVIQERGLPHPADGEDDDAAGAIPGVTAARLARG
jgi:hypothetical protein